MRRGILNCKTAELHGKVAESQPREFKKKKKTKIRIMIFVALI